MIKPALTPEQWELKWDVFDQKLLGLGETTVQWKKSGELFVNWDGSTYDEELVLLTESDRHGLAALCLFGQPLGFNPPTDANGYPAPDFVQAIRDCADALDRQLRTTVYGMQDDRSIASFAVGFARQAADRIEALLPQEKK